MSEQDPPVRRRRGRAAAPKTTEAKTPPEAPPKPKPKGTALGPNEDIVQKAKGPAKFPKAPDIRRGFQLVVNDLFADGYDVVEEYETIKTSLMIPVKNALVPGVVKEDANLREDLAFRAHRLHAVAKVEVAAYMRETESVSGAIRDEAIQHMEREKANGKRSKQITDKDALTEAARMFPDEWGDICSRRERVESMAKTLEKLALLAESRCHTVRKMIPDNRSV